MAIEWGRILPVIVSICIILLVAILRDYSRTFASVAATMPINLPLGLWLVYSGADDKPEALLEFSRAGFFNVIPTVVFIFIAWMAARAGWTIIGVIGAGYLGWGVTLTISLLLQKTLT
jgi:hypothetical protein